MQLELAHSRLGAAGMERWLAFGAGVALIAAASSRRRVTRALLLASSAPLLYRGIANHWPMAGQHGRAADALSGDQGIHVRQSIWIDQPVDAVYGFWRRLENLPVFMAHLREVSQDADGTSHWLASGPAGFPVSWSARIINDVENRILAWESLEGSDVVTAGSVNFAEARGGRGTYVRVHLRFAPPGGRAGAFLLSMFGEDPSRSVRDDLGRLKQLLERA